MTDESSDRGPGDGTSPAGPFAPWLDRMEDVLRGGAESEVPCGGCTACCSSSQFVHVAPDELDARAHIPQELLFPAPGLPEGHSLMGYDELGRCPMLVEDRCSIYEHRPRTCRTYDCRVFPAAGLEPDAERQPLIATRARRWRFELATPAARVGLAAVRRAAARLQDLRTELPDGHVPNTPTQLAVLAIEVHELFLDGDPTKDEVAVAIRRVRRPG